MDLTSSYAGIELASPVVVGASPLALDINRIKELASGGAGAIVMPSIFEEQILENQLRWPLAKAPATTDAEEFGPLPKSGPDLNAYNGGVDGYLRYLESGKAATMIPIIASINCATTGSWMQYARELESAGADAIELNLYHYEVRPNRFADDIEKELIDRAHKFCDESRLPVAVKLLPQFTSLPNIVFRLAGAGAKSVCLFGQSPAINARAPKHFGYSWRLTTQADLRVRLEGIHAVRNAARNLTLAASGGIHTPEDALIAFRLGADVVMLTSAIYKQGSSVINTILDAVRSELEIQKMLNLRQLIGSLTGGYDPFPEGARRKDLAALMAAYNPGDIDPKAD